MEGQDVRGGEPFALRSARLGSWRVEGRQVLAGLLMGWLAALAFIVSGVIRMMGDVWVPVASLSALLLLASKPLANRVMRWADVPRGEVVAALAMLGACPVLLLGALYAMSDPIVSSHWRCGTGDAGLVIMAPFAFVVLGGLGGFVTMVAMRRERRWVNALLRGVSLCAITAAATLAVMAFVRRHGRTDADHYIASLPIVATVPPPSGEPVEIREATFRWQRAPIKVYDTTVEDVAIRRLCMDSYCDVVVKAAGEPWSMEHETRSNLTVGPRDVLSMKRDVENGLLVLEGQGRTAFRDKQFTLVDVGVHEVKRSLAPPLGWGVGAAAGVVIALCLQLWRASAKRRLGRLAAAKAGVAGENGWISFEDETPSLRADNVAAGPVLVLLGEGSRGDAYRGEGPRGVVEILSGAREEILLGARSQLLALDALSLSSVVLTAMPLVASAMVGILL